MRTPDDAKRWVDDNHATAERRPDGRVTLPIVPDGVKVPGWVIPTLEQWDGDFPTFAPNGAAPAQADRKQARAREQEQRAKMREPIADKQPDTEQSTPALVTDSYHRFALRRVNLWQTITEGVEPHESLVTPWLYQRSVTALTGAPGSGKTHLLLHAAAAVLAMGKGVLLFDEELGPADTADRLASLGVTESEMQRLHYFPFTLATFPSLAAAGHAVMQYVESNAIALIVLDSLSKGFSAFGLDENSNSDATRLMATLFTPLVHVSGRTFLFADHVTKDEFKSSRYGRGASAKLADTNIQWVVEMTAPVSRDQRGRVVLTKEKDTFAVAPAVVRFDLGPDDDGTFTVTIEGSDYRAAPKARKNLLATIRALHGEANSGMSYTDWFTATGVTEKTFKNHRRDLVNDGAVQQDGTRYRVSQRGMEAYFTTAFGEGVGRG